MSSILRRSAAAFICAALGVIGCGGGGGGSDSGGPPINTPPVASFTAMPAIGAVPLEVRFNAAASTDAGGSIASYVWDFGDGSASASGVTTTHTFQSTGRFTVTLTVADNVGARGSATQQIAVSGAASYRLTDITAFAGNGSGWARDVNDLGQVVGHDQYVGMFVWEPGTQHVIIANVSGIARAMNNNGLVLRTLQYPERTFIWNLATGEDRPVQTPPGGDVAVAQAINNSNVVAGLYLTSGPHEMRAFIWDSDANVAVDLQPMIGDVDESRILGINDAGQVAGFYRDSPYYPSETAFVLDVNTGQLTMLGDLGGGLTFAGPRAINASGQVVGYSGLTNTVSHAFFWSPTTRQMIDLGDLPGGVNSSVAEAVNDAGQVVGWSHGTRSPYPGDTDPSGPRGFVWDSVNGLSDLNNLISSSDPLRDFVEIREAYAINNNGQIVAVGSDRRTLAWRAYSLTPVRP